MFGMAGTNSPERFKTQRCGASVLQHDEDVQQVRPREQLESIADQGRNPVKTLLVELRRCSLCKYDFNGLNCNIGRLQQLIWINLFVAASKWALRGTSNR